MIQDEAPLRNFFSMWAFLLGNRGVSFENTIVFYDDFVGNTSVRGFWMLELFGHKDVHVLDGGYGAWERAGFETTRDAEVPQARLLSKWRTNRIAWPRARM